MQVVRVITFCILILPYIAFASEFASLDEAKKITNKAVSLFEQEKIVAGYNVLKPYWPIPAVEVDSLASKTNTQWPMIKQRFGTSIAVEFVGETKAGESLARFVYLQKFQNHAVRWIFIFYKPKDRWVINAVSFDDRLELLFEKR